MSNVKGFYKDRDGTIKVDEAANELAKEELVKMLENGTILLLVMVNEEGEIGVRSLVRPSMQMVEILNEAAKSFEEITRKLLQ